MDRSNHYERAFEAYLRLWEAGVMLRNSGDILCVAPPLIIEEAQVARIAQTLRDVLTKLD